MSVVLDMHFTDPSPAQLVQRRHLLDAYGQWAQVSILLLPLLYQLALGLMLLHQCCRPKGYMPLARPQQAWILWLAGPWRNTPRGPLILVFCWTIWLLLLIFIDTEHDYLHLTKRFGIVAASQLPLHFLLAAKGWTPIQYLMQLGHEELNVYHRLLGRAITALMASHALLYLNFYIQKGILGKRIRDRDVQLGVLAVTIAGILFATSCPWLRQRKYRIFFYLHVGLSASLIPVLYFHVSHIRIYIVESLLIYAGVVLQRTWAQVIVQANVRQVPDTSLLSVIVPMTPELRRKRFMPGQHVYLSFPQLQNKLRLNPFSVASLPHQDGHVQLIVRPLSGTTALLDHAAMQTQPVNLVLEGPYGSAQYFPDFSCFDSVLLIAGGVGATFTVPLYRHMKQHENVTFVWVVRQLSETRWASNLENPILYITGKHASVDGLEMEPLTNTENIRHGRPDFRRLLEESLESSRNAAILACGPPGMAEAVRRPLQSWTSRGNVWWHSEDFGW